MTTNILQVKLDDVVKVYSGRPRCGCGCCGKYHVNPAHLELANKLRGYDYEPGDVNLTEVKRILLLQQEAESRNPGCVKVQDDEGETIYSLQTDNRYRWVFVKKN
jgi:hypothetical protein